MRVFMRAFLVLSACCCCVLALGAGDFRSLAEDAVKESGAASKVGNGGVTVLGHLSFSPPTVVYENGQLSIRAENCSLRDILEAVHKQTGATIESASIATGVRFAAYIRQGNPAHVLADLLYSSGLNYIIVGSGGVAVDRIILMPRSTAPEQIASAKLAPAPKVDTSALAVTPAAALPAVSITEATDKDPSATADDKQATKGEQQDDKAQLATSSAKPGGNDSTSDAGQTPAPAGNAAKVPEEKPAPSPPPDQEASSSLPPLPGGAASEALMRNLFPSLFAQSQSGGSTTATSGSGLTQNPFASSNSNSTSSNSGGSNSINQTNSSTNPTPATQGPSAPLQIHIGLDGNPVIPGVPPEWVPQLCQMTGMTCAQLINAVKNPPPASPPAVTCQLNPRTQVASCH
jgi:hypothetical protein